MQNNDYINKYIKDNYKTIKLKVRNDNNLILNKINNIDNVNKYLTDLIIDDILRNSEFNYIDNNIKIYFEVPYTIKHLMTQAELADLADDYGMYMNLADTIDEAAKHEVEYHRLTEEEWEMLERRYVL